MSDAAQKPAEEGGQEHLNLRVVSQDGVSVLARFFLCASRVAPAQRASLRCALVAVGLVCAQNEVFFKIKSSTPLRKLMDAYTRRNQMAPDSVRFLFDGTRLQPDKTPKEVSAALSPLQRFAFVSPSLARAATRNDAARQLAPHRFFFVIRMRARLR